MKPHSLHLHKFSTIESHSDLGIFDFKTPESHRGVHFFPSCFLWWKAGEMISIHVGGLHGASRDIFTVYIYCYTYIYIYIYIYVYTNISCGKHQKVCIHNKISSYHHCFTPVHADTHLHGNDMCLRCPHVAINLPTSAWRHLRVTLQVMKAGNGKEGFADDILPWKTSI